MVETMCRVLVLSCALVCTGFCADAYADQDDVAFPGMTAAIDVGRYHTEFAYPTADHRVDVERYALVITQSLAPDLDVGFDGAYLVASVDSPALATLDAADGQALGLFATWHPRLGNYLGLELQAGYRRNDADFSSPAGQPEVTWYESHVAAGPVFYLYNWRISAGVRWQRYEGNETDPGMPPAKLDFSAARSSGTYLGLTYYLDRTGSLTLYAFAGGQRGAQLVFKREF
ncbi:MAG: hypothetical protein ACRESC_05855 [Gammaproteobacteria bacterium]